jgi:hypothetical protein
MDVGDLLAVPVVKKGRSEPPLKHCDFLVIGLNAIPLLTQAVDQDP